MSTATAYGLTVTATSKQVTFVEAMSARSTLTKKTGQLRSLLSMLYGEGGEVLRGLADEVQDEIMWLAADLANEVDLLASAICTSKEGQA